MDVMFNDNGLATFVPFLPYSEYYGLCWLMRDLDVWFCIPERPLYPASSRVMKYFRLLASSVRGIIVMMTIPFGPGVNDEPGISDPLMVLSH